MIRQDSNLTRMYFRKNVKTWFWVSVIVALVLPGTTWAFQVELVKFVVPNREKLGSNSLPIFIAIPDTLCGLPIKKMLFASEDQKDSLTAAYLDGVCFNSHPEFKDFLVATDLMLKFEVAKGIESLRKLDKLKKDSALDYCVKLNWAVFQYLLGQNEWIERDLKKILDHYPWKEGTWKNLFSIYLSRKKYVAADELVEEILKIQPKTIWAQEYKINLIQMLGTQSDLHDYLKQKASWRDSMFAIQVAYGTLLKEKGETEGAVRYLTRGLEGDPKNGEGWLQLAEIYYRQGKHSFVNRCLYFAVTAGIHNPIYFELLAGVLSERIQFLFVKKKLLEKDIQKCYYARDMGGCKAYYEKIIHRDIDSNFIALKSVLENSMLQSPEVRNVAQQLAIVYGALGDGEAFDNFTDQFWFHFEWPFPFGLDFGFDSIPSVEQRLNIKWTSATEKYVNYFYLNDVYRFRLGR